MKTADKRWKTVLAAALFPLAIGYFAWTFFFSGDAAPSAAPAAQQSTPAAGAPAAPAPAVRTRSRRVRAVTVKPSLDPRLRLDLLRSSEEAKYEGKGRNIFEPYEPPPPVEEARAAARKDPPKVEQPPPPPVYTPPPIPLKFFGVSSRSGEPRVAFLQSGEDVFLAREGEIVNRRYRVLRIGNNSVEIEDVMTNHRQNIPLTAG